MPRSICDLADDHGASLRVMQPVFRDFGGASQFHGQVTTVRCLEDNALLKSILATPGNGRVIVVDGGGSLKRALFGDNLGSMLLKNGWAGIVIHGAVRDVEHLKNMPIAVRALAACPIPPRKMGLGERDVVVTIAGTAVTPGDWLYADENGAVLSADPIE